MAGTVRTQKRSKNEPTVRLWWRVLCCDDVLAPASLPLRWPVESLIVSRGAGLRLGPQTLTLDDPQVSTRHARLTWKQGQVLVEDLGSSNGTRIDGKELQAPAVLDEGAILEVGHTFLCWSEVPLALAVQLEQGLKLGRHDVRSPSFGALLLPALRAASMRESVLLLGETGSGKDVFARELHALSRRTGEFVAVDAGAVPETLFESIVFGHERGAFTGALAARVGELVRADGGTFFLDEVGNLATSSQARLLRALESGEVTPLGARAPRKVDVRVIAATNAALALGFREDLRHRLSGFVLNLPALRERREDLGVLVRALLVEAGVTSARLGLEAARALFQYPFPGNVRELRNVLRRAAVGVSEVSLDELEFDSPVVEATTPSARGRASRPSVETLAAALEAAGGSVSAAARTLQTSPRQLYRWLEHSGIDQSHYRS
jgi:sigma-54 dependent transcriptional regulator, acetoin dehydrogenase operon transcriptional activator AcoR